MASSFPLRSILRLFKNSCLEIIKSVNLQSKHHYSSLFQQKVNEIIDSNLQQLADLNNDLSGKIETSQVRLINSIILFESHQQFVLPNSKRGLVYRIVNLGLKFHRKIPLLLNPQRQVHSNNSNVSQTTSCIQYRIIFILIINQKKKSRQSLMFSLPCQGSFTPLCFNFVFFTPSFYCAEESTPSESLENKTVFSPILIPSRTLQEQKMVEGISQETKFCKKENSNEKCETQDEEYTPGNSQQKKGKRNQQNENRNIMPNIVNQILSFIQKKNKSLSTTERIFEKYNAQSQWSIKRFYLYQSMLKNKISHYVNEQTMKIFMKTGNIDYLVYSQQQQQFYNKVSRIMVFHFLHTEAQTSTLTSKRMDKSKKALHIEVQTQLTQKLKQIYKMH